MPLNPTEQAAVDRMAATTPADFDGNGYELNFPNRLNDAAIGIGAAGREISTTAASAAAAKASQDAAKASQDAAKASEAAAAGSATEAVAAQTAAKGSSDAASALAASFQIDPVARLVAPPTKDIRFLPDIMPAGVTVDRATVGFRTNRFGLMETIAANGPRHDYDPITGAYLGVMVGPGRANVTTWSEDFANAAWIKERVSVSADTYRAPDGTMTADKIVENGENNTHFISRMVPVTPETSNALSFFARAGERSIINFQVNTGVTDTFNCSVNLINGVVTGSAAARVRLRKLPDGWWRISITFTPSAGVTSVRVAFQILVDPASGSYQGDGASGLYLWGAQCEVGSAETSYIKTEGASASRAADNISPPIASDVINPAEATFYWEGVMGPSLGGNLEEALFSLDDGTLNNYLMLFRNAARRACLVAVSQNPGNNVVFSLALATWGANPAPILNDHAVARVALTTNRQVSRLAVNGASVEIPHRAGSLWTLSRLANLRLGHRVSTGTHMPGHHRRFLATPRYLTAAEIEALTRI